LDSVGLNSNAGCNRRSRIAPKVAAFGAIRFAIAPYGSDGAGARQKFFFPRFSVAINRIPG
jgi:hypothetical protein